MQCQTSDAWGPRPLEKPQQRSQHRAQIAVKLRNSELAPFIEVRGALEYNNTVSFEIVKRRVRRLLR